MCSQTSKGKKKKKNPENKTKNLCTEVVNCDLTVLYLTVDPRSKAAVSFRSVRTDSVWIGMRREADGFADMWLNGEQLDKAAYPTLEAKVGRVKDANEFCGRINVNGGIGDSNCTHALPSLCETYKCKK